MTDSTKTVYGKPGAVQGDSRMLCSVVGADTLGVFVGEHTGHA